MWGTRQHNKGKKKEVTYDENWNIYRRSGYNISHRHESMIFYTGSLPFCPITWKTREWANKRTKQIDPFSNIFFYLVRFYLDRIDAVQFGERIRLQIIEIGYETRSNRMRMRVEYDFIASSRSMEAKVHRIWLTPYGTITYKRNVLCGTRLTVLEVSPHRPETLPLAHWNGFLLPMCWIK